MIRLPELDVEKTASTLVKNIRALFQEKEFERAILGLSGGVDSALALALAREALGEKYIKGIIMPYKTSNPASQEDAIQLSQKFNTAYEVHPITPMADAYFERDPQLDAARRGNIMARLRMLTLYDLSARDNALVVGTGNKTEILLGYSTLWGDTACGLNPLGNLYKYQV
ncbi:MAG TPA: NAD(+) synthase [Turneriella sp.]|nr:NAD(+) synthase [Turneriella sp.]